MQSIKPTLIVLLIIVLSGLATAQLPQRFEYQAPPPFGSNPPTLVEWFALPGGDVNADGNPDLITFAEDDAGGFYGNLEIHIITAKDGSHVASYPVTYLDGNDDASSGVHAELRWRLDGGGDIDGDGHDDIIVSSPDDGACWWISGATGAKKLIISSNDWEGCGDYVAFMGDLNGNGRSEVAVSIPRYEYDILSSGNLASRVGQVRVFTFDTAGNASSYWGKYGSVMNDYFGKPILNFGDQDGDGMADLLVGRANGATHQLLSGVDGSVIRTLPTGLGGKVTVLGDLNADGRRDYAFSHSVLGILQIDIHSGLDDEILQSYTNIPAMSAQETGDVDGDGHDDYLIKSTSSGLKTFEFRSGANHALIESFTFPVEVAPQGQATAAEMGFRLGDVNGDGFEDVSSWSPIHVTTGGSLVQAQLGVFSLAGERRYGEGLGSPQTLDLSWLPPSAGDPALGAIRCSGASPGALGLAGVSLAPANFDFLGLPVLIDNGPGNLIASLGFGFDIAGQITTPGDLRSPWVAGTTFYFQFFTTYPNYSCSNGLELRFTQ